VNPLLQIRTLGALKAAGYKTRSIKDELRENLVASLQAGTSIFQGIHGYEDSVIPDMERALLSRHNMLLLGLRGQAKTRLARMLTALLDEYIPVVEGSELNDDPFAPLSRYARDLIAERGDDTPIAWLHHDDRYTEKLATPDVTVADLIGDVDPIKAANLRLNYNDERVIHYGLIPRSHRCIFVINELPDLQARIQVSLFNILQEGDIQIRGFRLRLPLDIGFVFTANPEDYTNRGSIVTPLKDRIESQILTHYPKSIEVSRRITSQEAHPAEAQRARVEVGDLLANLIEQVAVEARGSEHVDQKSGVSARLTISAYENLMSAAERRALRNGEARTFARISDLEAIVTAITGKVELVYEGEQEGPAIVAQNLVGKAIRSQFKQLFPDPEALKKRRKPQGKGAADKPAEENPYQSITRWFGAGHHLDLLRDIGNTAYRDALHSVPGLSALVARHHPQVTGDAQLLLMEFVLHGMAEHSLIGKARLERGAQFRDLVSGMFSAPSDDDLDEDDL
jgi:magnesium chelatase subunit I